MADIEHMLDDEEELYDEGECSLYYRSHAGLL